MLIHNIHTRKQSSLPALQDCLHTFYISKLPLFMPPIYTLWRFKDLHLLFLRSVKLTTASAFNLMVSYFSHSIKAFISARSLINSRSSGCVFSAETGSLYLIASYTLYSKALVSESFAIAISSPA